MEETLGLGARLGFPGRRISESQDRCESELGKAMSTSSSPCAVRWDTLILCVQQDSGLTGLLLGVLPLTTLCSSLESGLHCSYKKTQVTPKGGSHRKAFSLMLDFKKSPCQVAKISRLHPWLGPRVLALWSLWVRLRDEVKPPIQWHPGGASMGAQGRKSVWSAEDRRQVCVGRSRQGAEGVLGKPIPESSLENT